MRRLIRSEGGCYLLSLVSMGLGVGAIYLAGDSSWTLLALPLILASIAFLFLGMWWKLRGRLRSAAQSARDLPGKIRDIQETARRKKADKGAPDQD